MGQQWMELQQWLFPLRFMRENLKLGEGGEEGRDNDIARATFTGIVPLGLKNFLGLPFDGSDRDGPSSGVATNLQTDQPVFGQYMPDAIASFASGDGRTWYLIANEGDDRDDFITPDETARVSALNLDDARFPKEVELKTNGEIGRLTVSNAPGNNGDTDRDGDIDRILAYGARSFSILNSDGAIVFDSGSHMEQFVAAGGAFTNAAGSGLFDDTRSDNKGPEPEGVTVGRVGDRTLAFVGLERGGGGVMIYDVTNPLAVSFVQYMRRPGDEAPEGGAFVAASDSPNGKALLVVSNEVSKTVSVYQNQTYTLQLLHLADGAIRILRREHQIAHGHTARIEARDERPRRARRHEGPRAVHICNRLRQRRRHVRARMELQLHDRSALNVL
jgi:hypothetical protein